MMFLVSGFWFLVSGFWFLVSGFWFLVSGFWFLDTYDLSVSLSLTVDFLAPLLPGTLYAFVSSHAIGQFHFLAPAFLFLHLQPLRVACPANALPCCIYSTLSALECSFAIIRRAEHPG
jgi:hypothetical protein